MTESTSQDTDQIREVVSQRYAAAATRVAHEGMAAESGLQMLDQTGCCGTQPAPSDRNVITSDLYPGSDVADLPPAAVLASLGCGNPTALAELKAGETVLDLGSGGGSVGLAPAQGG